MKIYGIIIKRYKDDYPRRFIALLYKLDRQEGKLVWRLHECRGGRTEQEAVNSYNESLFPEYHNCPIIGEIGEEEFNTTYLYDDYPLEAL